MESERIIIIGLCIIVVILIVGVLVLSPVMQRQDCNLAIENEKIIQGDSLVVKLTDSQGNPIANETVNVKFIDDGKNTSGGDFLTDSEGKIYIKADEIGEFSIECTFAGNLKYSYKSISGKIAVESPTTEVVSEEKTSNYDSVSGISEDGYSYYPEYGPAVDAHGTTREYAIANNWHYIPMTIDGVDCGGYVPYDPNSKCYHT